jgi:DnaJ homolog subfamily C member 9
MQAALASYHLLSVHAFETLSHSDQRLHTLSSRSQIAIMPRKTKDTKAHSEDLLDEPPTSINPYEVLSLEKTATAAQVKSAYRKAALRHHPDKAPEDEKENAHEKFQEIALAYAILSDERRRKRYDTTGNTSESLDIEDDDFNWTDFFREQTATMVDGAMIEKIKKEYQGSEEERADILAAYTEFEGDMDAIYEQIMCSNVLEDDERFHGIIDAAIEAGDVEGYRTYTKESKASKKKRIANAKSEANEAMEMAEELGVKDKLFGGGSGGGSKKKKNDEEALMSLIQQRNKSRGESFFADLEAKYGGGGKRKTADEPPEEAFARNAKAKKRRK